MELVQEIAHARRRIGGLVRETPVERSRWLSRLSGCDVYLKLENFQHTGSFKVRGALNKLAAIGDATTTGIVAASAGNHGAGIAYAVASRGGEGIVFLPEQVASERIDTIADYGLTVTQQGQDCLQTEIAAQRYAEEKGWTYVSPYNDQEVIAGQGTIGVELVEQIGEFDAAFIALGGGGLISGVATYLKSVLPRVRIVACSPENSPVMHLSIPAGRILEVPTTNTLSHSTAGGVEPDSITLDICRRVVDDRVLVTENEIRESMGMFIDRQQMLIEGAAAVACSAMLKESAKFAGQRVVVLICGANVSREQLKDVVGS